MFRFLNETGLRVSVLILFATIVTVGLMKYVDAGLWVFIPVVAYWTGNRVFHWLRVREELRKESSTDWDAELDKLNQGR